MPMSFEVVRVPIPRDTGRRNINFESGVFASRVIRAAVAINGFKLQYDDPDHEIKVVEVDADFLFVEQDMNKVVFSVQCNLADKNDDDSYSGDVFVLVIAEVQ